MLDYYILLDNKKVEPVKNALKWGRWMEENRENSVVKQEDVGDYRISTVFLGLDHGYLGGGLLLFETMVFKIKGKKIDYSDLDMERYPDYAEAVKGHKRMVNKWKKKIN